MEALGKWVRFVLGIRAWLLLALPAYAFALARSYARNGNLRDALDDLPGRANFVAGVGVVGLISFIAWWALRKGWPSARPWALLASVIGMFEGSLGIAAGIAGLIAFWRPDTVAAMARAHSLKAGAHKAGDGTHKYIDRIMPVLLIVVLIGGQYLWARWGMAHGLPHTKAGSGWLLLLLAVHIGVICHEAGHFLAGWSLDMVLRHFQLGPFGGIVRSGRWRFQFVLSGLIGGGAVAMVPKHLKNFRGRKVLLILAGPVASLLMGSIAALLALSAKGSPWEPYWEFLALLGTLGFFDFFANLVPQRPESAYSDGAQIYQLLNSGTWAELHLAMAMVGSSLATAVRPKEWEESMLRRAADATPSGVQGLHMRMLLAMHYLDRGETPRAIETWREALALDPAATEKLETDCACEIVFYEAAIAGDIERARLWWKRIESKNDSRKEIDYWKARTAMLMIDGHRTEAIEALRQGDLIASKMPAFGAYQFDRWCLDVLRAGLESPAGLENLKQALAEPMPVPMTS